MRDMTNLSAIDFGSNRFKGTVSSTSVEGIHKAYYISFYDNDSSCKFASADNRIFTNLSWVYIGNV